MKHLIALVLLLSAFIVSCASPDAVIPEQELLIVDGAMNISERRGSDRNRSQVSYSILLEYPNKAIGSAQSSVLNARGWIECSDSQPRWITFEDSTTTNGRVVHRHTRHWIRDNKFITVSLNYYSEIYNPRERLEPDNDMQYVTILIDHYEDLDLVIQRLDLSCPPITGSDDT